MTDLGKQVVEGAAGSAHGSTSRSAPVLAALLPLFAGPVTLGLLALSGTDTTSLERIHELWLQGGPAPMTAAAVVAAVAAALSGAALLAAGRGRSLALGGLPALALLVMVPGLVAARLGWVEVARAISSSAPDIRHLVVAAGALEAQRALQVTLLFDAVLFTCWAGALLVLALDGGGHRRALAALALLSTTVSGALGSLARSDLLLADAYQLVSHLRPSEHLATVLPVLARWTEALALVRAAWVVLALSALSVAPLLREKRTRAAVFAWTMVAVVGVTGARALAALPADLGGPARPRFDPAEFLSFEGVDEDLNNVSHVLSGDAFVDLQTHEEHWRALVARDARPEAVRALVHAALEHGEGELDFVGLGVVAPPSGTEVPPVLRPILVRVTSVHVAVSSAPRCTAPCATARLDAEGLQLDDGQRWLGTDHGPGRSNPSKPLVVRLATWEPRWVIRAAQAATTRGFTLVVTNGEEETATIGLLTTPRLEGPPVVLGPRSVRSVQERLRAPTCRVLGSGRTTLRFVVGTGGAVSRVDVVSSTAHNATFEQCLAESIGALHFSAAPGPTVVTQQFVTTPE